MNGLQIVKLIATGIVGIGTGKIVKGIIKSNIEAPEKLFDKITIVAATGVISSVVARETKKYTDETIDAIATAIIKMTNTADEADEIVNQVADVVGGNTPVNHMTTVVDAEIIDAK